jgi:NADPH-dependent ferric siderophore reductase
MRSDEPYRARVLRVERVVPRVARITLAGDALRELPTPSPGGHIRVSFGPDEPGDVSGREARHLRRTLTPRWFDAERGELVVEVVLHGRGLASDWAEAAQEGDEVLLRSPGGRYRPEPVGGRFVIAVDDTGVPAAGTIVEALDPNAELTLFCEVTDAADHRPVTDQRDVEVRWLHRADAGSAPGELLEEAVHDLPGDLQAAWYVAAEARTVRRLDRHLREERGAEVVEARGYWRLRED